MRCQMASWVAISMTGRRGASLPATDPSWISLQPSRSASCRKHGPARSGRGSPRERSPT
jgi:hypothetical protein